MTLVQGRNCFRQECSFISPSIALPDSFIPPELGNKLFEHPAGRPKTKPLIVVALIAVINIPKYSENDLQRILKTVIEKRAPVPASAPTVFKVSREKLKARFLDVYCAKSYIDC